MELGEKKGKEEGKLESESNKAQEIARSMKRENMTHELIAKLTGLQVEEIAGL